MSGKTAKSTKSPGEIKPARATKRAPAGRPEGLAARYPFEPEPGQIGPGPDQLREIGEIGRESDAQPQGLVLELMSLMNRLKDRRAAMGLSLADVSERSGLTRQMISKLENGRSANPTMGTVYRYAMALDAGVTFGIEEDA